MNDECEEEIMKILSCKYLRPVGAATGTRAVLAFRLSLIEAYCSEDGEHAEEAAAAVAAAAAAAAAAAPAPAAEAPATAEQQALPAAGAAWNVRACSTGSESPPCQSTRDLEPSPGTGIVVPSGQCAAQM